ncbi:MAG: hypothetical protein GSR86_07505 [Desulfurococcales archaeon]|nr:hypothetical protein [Desulfurococcales archaeon]
MKMDKKRIASTALILGAIILLVGIASGTTLTQAADYYYYQLVGGKLIGSQSGSNFAVLFLAVVGIGLVTLLGIASKIFRAR